MRKKSKNSTIFGSDDYLSLQDMLPIKTRYIEVRVSRKMLLAIIVSLLIHALILYVLIREAIILNNRPVNASHDTLDVQLNPLVPVEKKSVASLPKPLTPPASTPRKASPTHHHPSSRAILSALRPAPTMVAQPNLTPLPTPSENDIPVPTDMSSYINMIRAQKRAAAGENSTPQPSADEARMANIKRNLEGGGGIFQIIRVGSHSAEFTFRGWDNTSYSNPNLTTIYVQDDDNTDIEQAIVRKMIAIIREKHNGDFTWESNRLNRDVTLSARPKDNAGLEAFMLQEFFDNQKRPAEQ